MKGSAIALGAGILLGAAVTAQADVVTDWNNVWLDTIRATGGGPTHITRNGAIIHTSIYEAVNSIRKTHEPYIGFIDTERPVNIKASVSAAAHRALVALYPDRQSVFDDELAAVLDTIPNGPPKARGITLGEAAADQILAARANDNSDDDTPYEFGTHPGEWVMDNPELFDAPHGPNWWRVTPWVIPDAHTFKPAKPLRFQRMDRLLASPGYARQFNEVKSLGRRHSATRTDDETELAWFWANDRDGTYKPPGQINAAAQVVSEQLGLSVEENARLFALLNLGLADAILVTWTCKYKTDMDLWRPVTGIRLAHLDGNPRTERGANWQPLLDFTPPFPAYSSGHSAMGGIWASIMADFVGTDEFTYTIGTDEPIVAHVTRTFHSFSDAGREDALSRIYLGVHWRMDCEQAYATGVNVGHYVYDNVLRTRCPADYDKNGRLTATDLYAFVADYFQHLPKADYNKDGVVNARDMSLYVRDYQRGCAN